MAHSYRYDPYAEMWQEPERRRSDYNPYLPDGFDDDREPDPDDVEYHIERAQQLRWARLI